MNNRAGEMEVFVEAVERGSFTAAAERLGLSPSAISKLITRIEERLGTRLLVRSTRALQLTPEGEAYHQRAVRIIAEIEETERLMTSGGAAVPRGLLRVNSSVGFGTRYIVPLVPAFLARYPDVELDLSLSDGVIDIIDERADVAIRTGPMRDSGLKARKLGESRRVVVAAPDYLAKHGVPQTPDELAQHNCLTFNFRRSMDEWAFRYPGEERIRPIAVKGNFKANNGSIPAIKGIWAGDYVHDGEFWKFPSTTSAPKPVQQPHPPIWVAARDPNSHDFAVANGCNVQCTPLANGEAEISSLMERFNAACDKAPDVTRPKIDHSTRRPHTHGARTGAWRYQPRGPYRRSAARPDVFSRAYP